jgi:cell division septal protein FtsQ
MSRETNRRFGWWPSKHARRRVVVLALVLAAGLGGGYVWLRHSALVQIKTVTVNGLAGPNVTLIQTRLTAEAKKMTTLDFNVAKLRDAISGFRFVQGLTASTYFPSGIVINVNEQVPVATVASAGHQVVVDSRGLLLPTTAAPFALPTLEIGTNPPNGMVANPDALNALNVLGQAPYRLIAHIASVTANITNGVVVQLRNGPQLYFGPMALIPQKWIAAATVLADHRTAGAAYIDLSDPTRPAAG